MQRMQQKDNEWNNWNDETMTASNEKQNLKKNNQKI